MGIVIGGAVSVFVILRDNYRPPFFLDRAERTEGEHIELVLAEEVTFLNKASIMLTLNHVLTNFSVVINALRLMHIDDDVLEIIEELKVTAAYKNIKMETIGLDKFYAQRQLA